MLRKLWVSALKELRVIVRDREGLAVLFVMPIVFVVIMSLALQDFFRQGATPQFNLVVLDGDQGRLAQAIHHGVAALPYFQVDYRSYQEPENFATAEQQIRGEVTSGKQRFALLLPPGSTQRHDAALAVAPPTTPPTPPATVIELGLLTDPALRSDHGILARSALTGLLSAIESQMIFSRLSGKAFDPEIFRGSQQNRSSLRLVNKEKISAARQPQPSATQQNVPAYSLLAIFLLVVPLSATFIKEREQGSLTRLESMPVPASVVIGGKMLPYLMINLLQVALCFAVGLYALPLLGGEALRFGHSLFGILILSMAASMAAIGFGLLVAVFSRTTEQATGFGATAILLLAALGGIMVPKMLMPAQLQAVAAYSPLGWALDGYLDLFVRDAGWVDVLPRVGLLFAFALVCFGVAMWRYSTRAHLR